MGQAGLCLTMIGMSNDVCAGIALSEATRVGRSNGIFWRSSLDA
jgi:hypothetical protein